MLKYYLVVGVVVAGLVMAYERGYSAGKEVAVKVHAAELAQAHEACATTSARMVEQVVARYKEELRLRQQAAAKMRTMERDRSVEVATQLDKHKERIRTLQAAKDEATDECKLDERTVQVLTAANRVIAE